MKTTLPLVLFSVLAVAGCSHSKSKPAEPAETAMPAEPAAPAEPVATPTTPAEPAKPAEPAPPPAPTEASATLAPTTKSKSKTTGTVTFKEVEGGVEVTATVEGLTPGKHGYHVHETGDCSAPDASSAGGHFNPNAHKHGAPDAAEHHEGDFGNLTAGKDGKATLTFTMKGITVGPGPTSVVGKGFIVHAKADDLKTQPTGNAGDRVACGVIEAK